MTDPILAAYDAEAFRAQGRATIDVLADYLKRVASREAMPVLPWQEPADALRAWPSSFDDDDRAPFVETLARVVREANHLHHPRYVGHQVTAPLPAAALAELASAFLNNGMAVFEMGPSATAMETHLVRWLSSRVGYGPSAGGVFTSGGSAGNLTALLAARQARAGFDAWSDGAHAGPPLAVLVSSQAHYSIRRAMQIMGQGAGGAISVPVDDRFRMRADALDESKRAAERAGRKVIAVVASVCGTSTGSFDPLEPIADYCEERGLWLHADGAHGASLALSDTLRDRLAGIERADSVVWDAHKMMLMPALSTAVLFRDARRSYEAFSQEAAYLFEGRAHATEDEWHNVGLRTLECTKRMMVLAAYTSLATYGPGFFAEYVERMVAQASRFAERVKASPDFELAVEPECNIVCFRHVKDGEPPEARDVRQAKIRDHLVKSGAFYIVQTKLPKGLYLRVTIINPRTSDDDLAALLEAARRAA